MKVRIVATLLASLLIVGCGRSGSPTLYGAGDPAASALFSERDRGRGEFLAFEHNLVIDISEEEIDVAYNSVVEACSTYQEHVCEVLGSSIEYGDYKFAQVSMRVEPEGIEDIVKAATRLGTIIRRRTNVEDLAETITDLDSRISILTTTRDKLIALEKSEANDIDSLIKVATELTKVQSELEQLSGQSAYQHRRVDMEILSVQFVVQKSQSFWKPVTASLSSFGRRMSEGIGDTISAIAYLLPWSVLFLAVAYVLRALWRRSRSK
jgi:DNA repair ATPase RecN